MPRKKTLTISLEPQCLKWARMRAGFTTVHDFAVRLAQSDDAAKVDGWAAKVLEWEQSGNLTPANAEKLAHVTHTPIGYLFLAEPPIEELPIPDFRVVGNQTPHPTPDLMDVIYDALRRQDWYRDYLLSSGEERLGFVGSLNVSDDIKGAAEHIRSTISWDVSSRAQMPTWEAALRKQIEEVENIGVIVMRSGIVGNNTHRPLSISEFRGFALADDYAPALFINVVDAKAAQMFTLAHELVHIWLGVSGVSNLNQTYSPRGADSVESFCNKVAAELLVPQADLDVQWRACRKRPDRIVYLAKYFKVSSLVILRRLRDADHIGEGVFRQLYNDQLAQIRPKQKSDGGNFYNTIRARLGQRFISALVGSTLEGRTLYRDAFRLLGIAKVEPVHELAKQMGATV